MHFSFNFEQWALASRQTPIWLLISVGSLPNFGEYIIHSKPCAADHNVQEFALYKTKKLLFAYTSIKKFIYYSTKQIWKTNNVVEVLGSLSYVKI